MTDTITTAPAREQEPKCTYTVHVYREMRLRFDGIEAESPEQAAEKARVMHFDDADEWSDCEGQSLSALVDIPGDEEYEHSRVIDFEPGRMLDAAPKVLAALEAILPYARNEAEGLEDFRGEDEVADARADAAWEAVKLAEGAIAEATHDSIGRVA